MRQIVFLRGVNVGPRNRIAMSALRDLLIDGGFDDARTYMQSGNAVLSSDLASDQLARECKRRIANAFKLDIEVVVRTRDELAEVVRRNPLAEVAVNPKCYQVTFLSAELDPKELERLASLAADSERFVSIGREVYAWHPDGVARSRLWAHLAGPNLRVRATSRNWTTVTSLLAMAAM